MTPAGDPKQGYTVIYGELAKIDRKQRKEHGCLIWQLGGYGGGQNTRTRRGNVLPARPARVRLFFLTFVHPMLYLVRWLGIDGRSHVISSTMAWN